MMAAPMPHPFQSHVPATPPPEQPLFGGKGPMSPDMSAKTNTTTSQQQQQEAFFNMFAAHAQQAREQQRQKQRQQDAQQHHQQQQQQQPTPASSRQSSSSAPVPPQSQHPNNFPFGMNLKPSTSSPSDPTSTTTTFPNTLDPKYLAMASRIAAYYQQRCQAIANFQQQRCQQWANMQRAKCQEMMQATMLVVAWYIRDRIQRRRKRQKRVFKRGLEMRERQRLAAGQQSRGGAGQQGAKVTKGEVVRRWVLDVPIGVLPPSASSPVVGTTTTTTTMGKGVPQPAPEVHDPLQDPSEAIFALGGNPAELLPETTTKVEDKDSQLYTIADNLIKSQLARIDVPLLGVLNLDESDSEESSEEEEYDEYDDDEYEEDGDYEGEEYEDEEYEEEGEEEENVVYECYGPGVAKMQVTTAVPTSLHQQERQQHVKTEEQLVKSPSPEAGMGSEEVQLGTAGSGSGAGRKRGASEIS
ncbi:hypothetical protein B0T20DRAFT_224777 [Sordaria brevicollis]|uniref:Uncharacterized protein n=1 Tax=Sordaria brevicollis TaxID=83679 RepID=A0AAE0PCX2_SORBR|nr:hypothetical protein B0T20DRAFT_224777 [Sordaria brevicollis]